MPREVSYSEARRRGPETRAGADRSKRPYQSLLRSAFICRAHQSRECRAVVESRTIPLEEPSAS